MKYTDIADTECAIAQALAVVGDWWTLLVVRDVAGGLRRFDDLQKELGVSRKVLAGRLASLVEHGVLEKRRYQQHPPRYEYHLSRSGEGLMPVLIALQDWATRYVIGDGSLTATAPGGSPEIERVRHLVGMRIAEISLVDHAGELRDPISGSGWTVLYCYPGAYAEGNAYPVGWGDIPGTKGCTLESVTFRNRLSEFAGRDAQVVGVSTQRPEEQAAFAAKEDIPFPLVSDQDLLLAAALRLPTFRAAGSDRLKRVTLVVDRDRTVRGVLYPIADAARSVGDALDLLDWASSAAPR